MSDIELKPIGTGLQATPGLDGEKERRGELHKTHLADHDDLKISHIHAGKLEEPVSDLDGGIRAAEDDDSTFPGLPCR